MHVTVEGRALTQREAFRIHVDVGGTLGFLHAVSCMLAECGWESRRPACTCASRVRTSRVS